jgi:N-acetylneuraminic acid mutarotase
VVTAMTNSAPTARQGVAGAARADGLYHFAVGGLNASNVAVTTMERYAVAGTNGEGGTWATLTGSPLPAATAYGSMVVLGNFMYYVGGQTGSASSTATAVVHRYDLNSTFTWTTLTSAPLPAARTQGAMVAYAGKLYYLGGYDSAGTATTTVYVFDPALGTWSTAGWTLRHQSGAAQGSAGVIGSVVYVYANGALLGNDLISGAAVVPAAPNAPANHGNSSGAAVIGSTIYVVSGSNTANVDTIDPVSAPDYATNVRRLRAVLAA